MESSPSVQQEMTIRRWMFNPFIRIAGIRSLTIGLVVIVASGLVAAAGGIRFDGLLDVHAGNPIPLWVPVVEGLVNWIVITALLWLAALFFGRSAVRLVDIAGTQAMARVPLLPAAAICTLPWIRSAFDGLTASVKSGQLPTFPGMGFVVGALVILAGIIWMVALMWKAFSISCNIKGGRAIALFIVAVLIGEVVSKLLAVQIGYIGS